MQDTVKAKHTLLVEASDPQIIEALLKAGNTQLITAALPPQLPTPQYFPTPTPAQQKAPLHPLVIPFTLFCMAGSYVLITPQGSKMWDSLPAIQSWQQVLTGHKGKTAKQTKASDTPETKDLIFPLAGYSGKTKLAGSIPGDCRPLGSCQYKHAGADYGAPPGTPVLSIEDGVINELKPDSGVGGVIGIKSASGSEVYRYVHLDRDYLRRFKIGQTVSKGQVIGLVGPTFPGSSGPHLHLERYVNGALDWFVHKRFEKAVKK